MALQIDYKLRARDLLPRINQLFELSGEKIRGIYKTWNVKKGAPVFTAAGRYTSRGWTEWTEGFVHGSALLQFEAAGDSSFLDAARKQIALKMPSHVTHMGVHDHGFNNVSTYGTLLRLLNTEKMPRDEALRQTCLLALKVSGAVQAARWTALPEGGFIYSFNGPHSLFIDTMRSLRSLALAHTLGHALHGEQDQRIDLLERLIAHASVTAKYAVYYGKGRDAYDVRGRTAHESLFNLNNGSYRCPSTQQGYSPFSTWTRGLAWALLGFAELLEFLKEKKIKNSAAITTMEAACLATAEFYLEHSPVCGVPYWDTGAPGLARMNEPATQAADPFNDYEPVDSSAACIAAQGLWRLSRYLGKRDLKNRFRQSALSISRSVFSEPYLSVSPTHQGLILHSIYHRPNGWDFVPKGRKIPCGESSMWGDYHARELALLLLNEAREAPYVTFYTGVHS